MTVEETLTILKSDKLLKELLEASITDSKIYLNDTTSRDNSITYKYIPLINDAIKMQSRLEIDCISSNYEKGMQILTRVQKLLLTTGDAPLTNNLIEITQNGGGYVFDKDIKIHKIKAIFILKERMR